MKFAELRIIVKRLYKFYIKEHLSKILLALLLSFGVAGGTAGIAWLLDPAIKKIFIEKSNTMLFLIPIAIIISFSVKGLSLYFSRMLLIVVSQKIVKKLGTEMASVVLNSDISKFNVLPKLEACIFCINHDAACCNCCKISR